MPIPAQTVRHVARLARLDLDDDGVERYAQQLARILEHIDAISSLPLLPHAGGALMSASAPLRPDLPVDRTEDAERCLLRAPEREDRCYRVPRIIDP